MATSQEDIALRMRRRQERAQAPRPDENVPLPPDDREGAPAPVQASSQPTDEEIERRKRAFERRERAIKEEEDRKAAASGPRIAAERARPQNQIPVPQEIEVEKRMISRDLLLRYYWLWMGFIGMICLINSVGTTIVFTKWIVGLMFPSVYSFVAIAIGVGVAFGLFIGQLMNSTYEIKDPETKKIIVLRSRRTAYRLLLAPDVFMTVWFWFLPIMRPIYLGLSAILADNPRVLIGVSLWSAAAISYRLGVFSAQFPEKAATDPRLALGEYGKNFLAMLKARSSEQ